MGTDLSERIPHPLGEQPEVEEWSAVADTFAGRVHIEWDTTAPVTPLGQLPFFIEYLKQGGLFDGWVADCPLLFTSPNAPANATCSAPCCIGAGRAPALCPRHGTALRCGQPATAWHGQSGQRRCAAAGAGEDRRRRGHAVVARAS